MEKSFPPWNKLFRNIGAKIEKNIYINKICVCKRPLPRSCTFKLNCMYFWIIAHCCKGKFYPNPSYSHQNTTNQAITHSSIKGAGQYMRSRRVGHQFANVTTYTNINLPKNIKKKAPSRLFRNAECWCPPWQNLYIGTFGSSFQSQKEDHWQNPENFFFRGGHFWRAKSKKCKKKFQKILLSQIIR